MVELRGRFGFGLEALQKGGRCGTIGAQEFEGNDAIEADLAGFINDAHSAAGDFRKQLVFARLPRKVVLKDQRPGGARLQFQRAAEGADRAKALRGIGGQGRLALRTGRRRGHRCPLVVGYRSHLTGQNRGRSGSKITG